MCVSYPTPLGTGYVHTYRRKSCFCKNKKLLSGHILFDGIVKSPRAIRRYVKLQKALYGPMRASLLFFRKLQKELEKYVFVVNQYDPCVANKDVGGGQQLTIIWHVDSLMASCTLDFELTKLSC
jgi:hypothetical protein